MNPPRPLRGPLLSGADQERADLRRLAETEADPVAAVAAALIGHVEFRDGMRWTCACGFDPRPGEFHARHVAEEVLALLDRRAGARRAARS